MIERNQAIKIALKRAQEKGWEFVEPLDVFMFRKWWGFGLSHFEIWTNAGNPGTKTRFVIDAKAGEILSEEYIPQQITSEHQPQPETGKTLSDEDIPFIRICSVRSGSCGQTIPEQDQAIEIAHKRAEEKGWVLIVPLDVSIRRSWSGRPRRFEIMTNADGLGAKAHFVIDAKTGKILSAGYVPR